jgi:hypothetical protein
MFTWLRRDIFVDTYLQHGKSLPFLSHGSKPGQRDVQGEVNTQHAPEPQPQNMDTHSIKGSSVDDPRRTISTNDEHLCCL